MASRNFTITQDGVSRRFTIETGVGPRGAQGETGPPAEVLELTSPPENGVTNAEYLGQLAIVTIDGARIYSFRNINLSPMTWEGATPGLMYNATLSEWRIGTLTGADGSESITYGPL